MLGRSGEVLCFAIGVALGAVRSSGIESHLRQLQPISCADSYYRASDRDFREADDAHSDRTTHLD